MKQYTKEQKITAIKYCLSDKDRCDKCLLADNAECLIVLDGFILELIEQYEAEIDRLAVANECLSQLLEEANATTQEFIEKLKGRCTDHTTDNINEPCVRILYDADEVIDEVAEELGVKRNELD